MTRDHACKRWLRAHPETRADLIVLAGIAAVWLIVLVVA